MNCSGIEFENRLSVLDDSDSSRNSMIFYMLSAASSLLEYLHLRLQMSMAIDIGEG